jgi:hypothetical protein
MFSLAGVAYMHWFVRDPRDEPSPAAAVSEDTL